MHTTIDIEDLQRFPCFDTLNEAEATALTAHLEPDFMAAGQILFRQGDVGDCVYLLHAGQIDIRVHVPGGMDYLLARLEAGAIFGEISLLLNDPRTATAVAATDIMAWKVTSVAFQTALQTREPWATKLLLSIAHVLAHRLEVADEQLVMIIGDMQESSAKPQASPVHELEQLRNRLFTQWSF